MFLIPHPQPRPQPQPPTAPEEDRKERRKRLGLPEELTEEEKVGRDGAGGQGLLIGV